MLKMSYTNWCNYIKTFFESLHWPQWSRVYLNNYRIDGAYYLTWLCPTCGEINIHHNRSVEPISIIPSEVPNINKNILLKIKTLCIW